MVHLGAFKSQVMTTIAHLYFLSYIYIYISTQARSVVLQSLWICHSLEVALYNRHSSLLQLDGREDEVDGLGSLSVNNTEAVVDEKVINSSTVSCFAIPLDLSQFGGCFVQPTFIPVLPLTNIHLC